MPRGDGTGPMGTGPIGWGLGPCGRGMRRSWGGGGYGWLGRGGRAGGRGMGRRPGQWAGIYPYHYGQGFGPGPAWPMTAGYPGDWAPDERAALEAEMSVAQERLEEIRGRLSQLEQVDRQTEEE